MSPESKTSGHTTRRIFPVSCAGRLISATVESAIAANWPPPDSCSFAMNVYPQALRNRPRMVAGLIVGVLTTALVPSPIRPMVRLLAGWDVAVWTYLALIWIYMARANHEHVRDFARREDGKRRRGAVSCLYRGRREYCRNRARTGDHEESRAGSQVWHSALTGANADRRLVHDPDHLYAALCAPLFQSRCKRNAAAVSRSRTRS